LKRSGFLTSGRRHPARVRRYGWRASGGCGPSVFEGEGRGQRERATRARRLQAVVFDPIRLVEALTMRTESQDYKGFEIQVAHNPPIWQASIFNPKSPRVFPVNSPPADFLSNQGRCIRKSSRTHRRSSQGGRSANSCGIWTIIRRGRHVMLR